MHIAASLRVGCMAFFVGGFLHPVCNQSLTYNAFRNFRVMMRLLYHMRVEILVDLCIETKSSPLLTEGVGFTFLRRV